MITCPFCRKQYHTSATDRKPNDEDIMLCPRCGELGIFDKDRVGGLRKPTEDETRKMKANPELNMLRDRWRRLQQ